MSSAEFIVEANNAPVNSHLENSVYNVNLSMNNYHQNIYSSMHYRHSPPYFPIYSPQYSQEANSPAPTSTLVSMPLPDEYSTISTPAFHYGFQNSTTDIPQLRTEITYPEAIASSHNHYPLCSSEGDIRPEKRKCGSNRKERRRTQSINNAFANLRDCIPNVPCDTKLSKIKTLRLATSYIDYLMTLLNSENSDFLLDGFKAEIHKKWNEKSEEQKRLELEAELNNNCGNGRNNGYDCSIPKRGRQGKGGARTGWPQHVWALELKQ